MALYVGDTKIRHLYVNGERTQKAYVNGTQLFNAQVEFVGSAAVNLVLNQSATVDLSSIDIQEGDIILAIASNGYHTSTPIPNYPTGFTGIIRDSNGGSDRNCNISVSYKWCDGTEESVVLSTGSNISSSGGGLAVGVFRNVDTTNPFNATNHLNVNNQTTYNGLPVTTTVDGCAIVCLGSTFDSSGAAVFSSDLSGFVQGKYSGGTYGSVAACGYVIQEDAGLYDPTQWGIANQGGENVSNGITIALQPA